MQINMVILSGRLTANVKYSGTKNGTPRSRFIMANNQKGKSEYYPIVSFGKTADYAHKYLKKGQRLTLQGRLHHYAKKDDSGRYEDFWCVIANTYDPIHQRQSKSARSLFSKVDDLTTRVDKISQREAK